MIEQIHRLAEEYRRAAQLLRTQQRQGDPLSLAPCRLTAIHAIELYLNVLFVRLFCGQVGSQHQLREDCEHKRITVQPA